MVVRKPLQHNQVVPLHWPYIICMDKHGSIVDRRSFQATALAAVALESPNARREMVNRMLEYVDTAGSLALAFRAVFILRGR